MARPRQFDRDEILDRALVEFWRHGYAATSIDDLLAELGLARASMYRTFGNKAQFYSESLRRYRDIEHQLFERRVAGAAGAREAVQAVFDLVVEQSLDATRPRGCFIVAATAERVPDDPDTSRQVADQVAGLEEMFVTILRRGVDNAEISTALDPRRWGRFLATSMLGLRTLATAEPDRDTLEDVARAVLDVIDAVGRPRRGRAPQQR